MNVSITQVIAGIIPVVALLGFLSAAATASDRRHWSGSMKVFLAILVVSLALLPVVRLSVPPPPP